MQYFEKSYWSNLLRLHVSMCVHYLQRDLVACLITLKFYLSYYVLKICAFNTYKLLKLFRMQAFSWVVVKLIIDVLTQGLFSCGSLYICKDMCKS
jgi:hypothetical protein